MMKTEKELETLGPEIPEMSTAGPLSKQMFHPLGED